MHGSGASDGGAAAAAAATERYDGKSFEDKSTNSKEKEGSSNNTRNTIELSSPREKSTMMKSRYERSLSASGSRSRVSSPPLPASPTEQHASSISSKPKSKLPPINSVRSITPTNSTLHNEFLPDFNNTSGCLTPDEVRDAANFTSIQFECSCTSGEVEMFSGDEGDSPNDNCFQNEVWSEATTPSILNRGDIFHHKAASSIVSLLTPDRMFEAGLMAPEGTTGEDGNEEDDCPPDVNGDSPTGVASPGLTFDGGDDPGSFRGGDWKGTKQVGVDGSEVVTRKLFCQEGGRREQCGGASGGNANNSDGNKEIDQNNVLNALKGRMIAPSQQFSDLLSQIHRTSDNKVINRAYATRRKNACGALKILSAKEENRLKICWTKGVLQAISSVLADVKVESMDELASSANVEARNRVVSTLLNLSVNKKNRMLICNTPGVLESITQCILGDDGESRQGCCTTLLYLAKTSETRPLIIKCRGLLDALSVVVEVPKVVDMTLKNMEEVLNKPYQNRYLEKFNLHANSPGEETTLSGDDSSVSDKYKSSSRASRSRSDGSHSKESQDESSQSSQSSIPQDVPKMEICFKTPMLVGMKSEDIDYDADPNRFLHGARLSTFACLLCLVKNKENAVRCFVLNSFLDAWFVLS